MCTAKAYLERNGSTDRSESSYVEYIALRLPCRKGDMPCRVWPI